MYRVRVLQKNRNTRIYIYIYITEIERHLKEFKGIGSWALEGQQAGWIWVRDDVSVLSPKAGNSGRFSKLWS